MSPNESESGQPQEPPANPIDAFLRRQPFMVVDGALATELERLGADLRDRLWSAKLLVENPTLIKQVHTSYLLAGADVVTTASYQATVQGFMARGIDANQAGRLIQRSVQLAVEARNEFWSKADNRKGRLRPLVAASIGPYGAYLADGSEYRGAYELGEDDLVEFHRSRFELLVDTEADLLAFETIPCHMEGRALVRLLQESPGTWAWLAFSCRDGHHASNGDVFAECARLAEESDQIVAVGVNCTAPDHIQSLVQDARTVTNKPVIVYPNSGEAWDASTRQWRPTRDDPGIVAFAPDWCNAGAQLIGGCCRTTPEDIAALRAIMRAVP